MASTSSPAPAQRAPKPKSKPKPKRTSSAQASTSGSGLTWQQQAFQSTTSSATSSRPSSAFGALEDEPLQPSFPKRVSTPQGADKGRNRRQLARDAETFGLDELSLAPLPAPNPRSISAKDQETFGPLTPNRHHNNPSNGRGARSGASPRPPKMQPQPQPIQQTPTKSVSQGSVEPRYAGPTFHNSPAPSSLPTPSFMLRRQQAQGGSPAPPIQMGPPPAWS